MQPNARRVIVGVAIFVAIDAALLVWFETRPRPGASTDGDRSSEPDRPVATGDARPSSAASTTAPLASAPRASASVQREPRPAPRASTEGRDTPPSRRELDELGASLLEAVRAGDEAALRDLAPPGAAEDQTTAKMFLHERNVALLRDAAPKLATAAAAKGMADVIVARGPNEVRLKLYKADGAAAGKALLLRRDENGRWYVEQEVYMRDDR